MSFHGHVVRPQVAVFEYPKVNAAAFEDGSRRQVVRPKVAEQETSVDVLLSNQSPQEIWPLVLRLSKRNSRTAPKVERIGRVETDLGDGRAPRLEARRKAVRKKGPFGP